MSKDSGKNLNEAEVETLGYDHGAIGKRLGDSWNLPKPIVAAIAYHHDIEKNIYPEHEQLVAIVSLADTLVRLKKIGDSGNYGKTLVSLKMMNILKLTKEQIPVIIKEFYVIAKDYIKRYPRREIIEDHFDGVRIYGSADDKTMLNYYFRF